MTCKELIEFLAEYLDGGLTPGQRAAFERHLGLCRACADYLDAYRQTIRVVRATSQITGRCAPPPLPPDLVAAVTAAATRRP
ncbi:MAG: zf-HC2 domain-containing protein [Phycisphaerae bacterium]|nr:zf-HC2 domain-containing protein [Phycisphaerae bacterium]